MWCDQVLDKLFPKFSGLVIEDVIDIGGEVVVAARVRSGSAAACTACGATSDRVHDRYERRIKDARPLPLCLERQRGAGPESRDARCASGRRRRDGPGQGPAAVCSSCSPRIWCPEEFQGASRYGADHSRDQVGRQGSGVRPTLDRASPEGAEDLAQGHGGDRDRSRRSGPGMADTHHWLAAATSAHLQTMRVICFGRGRECAPWPSWPSRLQGALHALQQVGAPGRVRFWQVAKPRQTCRSDGVADEWKVARIGKFAGTPLVTEEPDRHALLGKDRLGPADTQAVFQRIETSNKARGMVDASGLEESAEALFVPVCW